MHVYLDNAATTPLEPAVLATMLPYMETLYGNPSSLHAYGRVTKVAIEKARRTVADLLHVTPTEIFFTSGGTEGNNLAFRGTIEKLAIKHVITSPIEHLAVLEPLQQLAALQKIQLHYVQLDSIGHIDYTHLEELLKQYRPALVSLMHGNNEIGNLNDLLHIGELCRQYQAIFHTDAVQTLGHYQLNLSELPVDILVGSAHKFHGPKGSGMIYINKDLSIAPQVLGGAQERGMRAGTENIPAIVGLSQALEITYCNMQTNKKAIERLKKQMIKGLQSAIPDISFYGDSMNLTDSIYTLLSVNLPKFEDHDMVLFNLDINHIAASSGSACTSGSQKRSHVMEALYPAHKNTAIRFSFSKYNTAAEIDYVIEKLAEIYYSSK
ncbi:MAG: cysteine desulfurase family protein [Candidatus Amoebophilus sp.]